MKLEVLVLPAPDVDRAKRFYEKLGFRLDFDYVASDEYRVIHLTPPGSAASIIFGKGVTAARPGSIDRLVLAVYDLDAARDELVSKGVEMLKSAATAHAAHEKALGMHDPDWPRWYAEHMARMLGGAGYHLTGPSA